MSELVDAPEGAKVALQDGDVAAVGVTEKGAVERIAAVAIKWRGMLHTAQPPRRHHHVIREMAQRGFGPECMHGQGFVTDRGRFVDRKEGMNIARAAGQLIRITGSPDTLFSEDLWLTPTPPSQESANPSPPHAEPIPTRLSASTITTTRPAEGGEI